MNTIQFLSILTVFMATSLFATQSLIIDLGGVLLKEPERNLVHVLPAHLIKDPTNTRIFNRLYEFVQLATGKDYKRAWFMGTATSAEIVAMVDNNIDNSEYLPFFKDEHERNLIKYGAQYILLPHHLAALTHIYEDGLAFIKQCKQQGIRLLILSNWDIESFLMLPLKFPELFSLFDEQDIFIPTKTGFMKPDLMCYEKVVEMAQLDKAETFFIDDSPTNAAAGAAAGLRAVHHKDWVITAQELKKAGLRI